MKKIFNTVLALITATILFSCQKQHELTERTAPTNATETKISTTERMNTGTIPITLSQWVTVDLQPSKDGGLYGYYVADNPLPATNDTNVKIAYVRRHI